MKIALDYDDTFTRDPELWARIIFSCLHRGHEIRIVTFRSKLHNNLDLIEAMAYYNLSPIPVIYTAGNRKRDFCANLGFFPDVWIDDMPELIVSDDTYIPGEMLARQLALQGNDDG